MTALHALLAAAIAGVLAVAGVAVLVGALVCVLAGVGAALIAAGVWIAVCAVLLYDPVEAGKRR